MPDTAGDSDNNTHRDKENLSLNTFTDDKPVMMSLERIIELTGELEHLNELVLIHIEKCGGFSSAEVYFAIVQPVLDQLEIEIRCRYCPGMTTQEITLIVQDWIDKEIVCLVKR